MRTIFQVTAAVLAAAFTANLGLTQEAGAFGRALRQWRSLARGLALTLVVVPLLTLPLVRALGLRGWVANALLVLAACPGAPFTARNARRLGADLPLTEVLVLLLGLITAVTAAPVGRQLTNYTGALDISPLRMIAKLLVLQGLPLLLGLAIRRGAPRWAERLGRATGLVVVLALALVVVLLLPQLPFVVRIGWRGALVAVLVMGFSMALGGLLGERPSARRALAAAAALPNIGLALVLVAGAQASPHLPPAMVGVFLLRALLYLALAQAAALASRRRGRPQAGLGAPAR